MYKNDEIIYGEPLGPRVLKAYPAAGYRLYLTFNNGEKRVFDARSLLSVKAFQPLRNKEFFESVKVEFGTVIWPQDIDYCPDTLYLESLPLDENN